MPYVLIVEDEADLAGLVDFNLRAVGLETAIAGSAEAALRLMRERRPDLVLLDLMLPDLSGQQVCRRVRADPELSEVWVVMLTARGSEPDRVEGFLAGADDYVTKPFSVRELVLRVQSLLKRSRAAARPSDVLTCGPFMLDRTAGRFFVDGAEVALTVIEVKLMRDLMSHAGQVRSRKALLASVWGITRPQVTRTVDTTVLRLRDKLGRFRDRLEGVRGFGYRLLEPGTR